MPANSAFKIRYRKWRQKNNEETTIAQGVKNPQSALGSGLIAGAKKFSKYYVKLHNIVRLTSFWLSGICGNEPNIDIVLEQARLSLVKRFVFRRYFCSV